MPYMDAYYIFKEKIVLLYIVVINVQLFVILEDRLELFSLSFSMTKLHSVNYQLLVSDDVTYLHV